MFIFSNLFHAIATVIGLMIDIYIWIVIIRAILSWFNTDPYNPIVRMIHDITEPVLHQVRRKIPTVFGSIDFAPIIVILALYFIKIFLVGNLIDIARRLA